MTDKPANIALAENLNPALVVTPVVGFVDNIPDKPAADSTSKKTWLWGAVFGIFVLAVVLHHRDDR